MGCGAVYLSYKRAIVIATIIAMGFTAYSNSFSVPFHFDDREYLIGNPLIEEAETFFHPERYCARQPDELQFPKEKEDACQFYRTRFLTYATFAVNYYFSGEKEFSYHVVNFIIHLLNALLVFSLISSLLQKYFKKSISL